VHEAVAAVKAAEAAIEQLANDRAAGLYAGAMGKHFPRLVTEAEDTLRTAQEHAASLTQGVLDITAFDDGLMLVKAWASADMPLKRDLLRVAIERITVRQRTAIRRGAPFDGDARVTIEWATTV
jgi:site-specific DNA recombinase